EQARGSQVSISLEPLAAADYRVSVVLPVYSETDSVREVVGWLRRHFSEQLSEILIIISPRSSAESRAVCDDLAAEDARTQVFVQKNNPGVGHAFREGYV